MRVLLVTDGIYPFAMGGMQKHSYYLAKYLVREGVRIHVVHCGKDLAEGAELQHPAYAGASGLSFSNVTFPALPKIPGHYLRANKLYSKNVLQQMRPFLDDFDLVYCQGFTAWAFIQAREHGELRIPVVSNLHGYEMFQRAPSRKDALGQLPLRHLAKKISLGSDAVFSFGGHISGILQRIGLRKENILECPIGIDESWLVNGIPPSDGGERRFVFVGRDERRKGLKELNLALHGLLKEGSTEFKFDFIGPVQQVNRIADARITYHGAVREEALIKKVLRSSDVLVCPSYSEGMPTVIMEAMASGLAILATDVGAVNQQVEGNGWLLASPEVGSIQSALEQAVRISAADLTAMKEKSLDRASSRFTWGKVIKRKVELLKLMLDRVA
jgi:glycosyltransferase involved in cell wall biosynthesis